MSKYEVKREGGSGIFSYHPTLGVALKAIYPEYDWDELRFFETRHRGLADINNQRELLEKIGKELGVKEVTSCESLSKLLIIDNKSGIRLV